MKIKLHYLFSNNNKIGSKIISWGTKHLTNNTIVPSHISLCVNNRWVFESTFSKGVKITSYSEWSKRNNIIKSVEARDIDYKTIKNIYKAIEDKKYDWFGVLYLSYYIVLNKLFKFDIPKVNRWEDKDKYFCSEAVGKISNSYLSMSSPTQIMEELDGDL